MLKVLDANATTFPPMPDGNVYPLRLRTFMGVYLADSMTDLIDGIVGEEVGYNSLSDEDALFSRWVAACIFANAAQSRLIREADFDPSQYDESILTPLFIDRRIAGTIIPPNNTWGLDVPLVLIRTDFAPFTDLDCPTGNIRFIDPSNERAFLTSICAFFPEMELTVADPTF